MFNNRYNFNQYRSQGNYAVDNNTSMDSYKDNYHPGTKYNVPLRHEYQRLLYHVYTQRNAKGERKYKGTELELNIPDVKLISKPKDRTDYVINANRAYYGEKRLRSVVSNFLQTPWIKGWKSQANDMNNQGHFNNVITNYEHTVHSNYNHGQHGVVFHPHIHLYLISSNQYQPNFYKIRKRWYQCLHQYDWNPRFYETYKGIDKEDMFCCTQSYYKSDRNHSVFRLRKSHYQDRQRRARKGLSDLPDIDRVPYRSVLKNDYDMDGVLKMANEESGEFSKFFKQNKEFHNALFNQGYRISQMPTKFYDDHTHKYFKYKNRPQLISVEAGLNHSNGKSRFSKHTFHGEMVKRLHQEFNTPQFDRTPIIVWNYHLFHTTYGRPINGMYISDPSHEIDTNKGKLEFPYNSLHFNKPDELINQNNYQYQRNFSQTDNYQPNQQSSNQQQNNQKRNYQLTPEQAYKENQENKKYANHYQIKTYNSNLDDYQLTQKRIPAYQHQTKQKMIKQILNGSHGFIHHQFNQFGNHQNRPTQQVHKKHLDLNQQLMRSQDRMKKQVDKMSEDLGF